MLRAHFFPFGYGSSMFSFGRTVSSLTVVAQIWEVGIEAVAWTVSLRYRWGEDYYAIIEFSCDCEVHMLLRLRLQDWDLIPWAVIARC